MKINKLKIFVANFKKGSNVYIEDSILWYCLDYGIEWYLSLSIMERINFKNSYFLDA